MESPPCAGSRGREDCSREASLQRSKRAAFCSFWFSVFPSLTFKKAFERWLALVKSHDAGRAPRTFLHRNYFLSCSQKASQTGLAAWRRHTSMPTNLP